MSSLALHRFRLAPILADAARDDLVHGGRLFWPETTYRVPANRVCSAGGCRMPAQDVCVGPGAGQLCGSRRAACAWGAKAPPWCLAAETAARRSGRDAVRCAHVRCVTAEGVGALPRGPGRATGHFVCSPMKCALGGRFSNVDARVFDVWRGERALWRASGISVWGGGANRAARTRARSQLGAWTEICA